MADIFISYSKKHDRLTKELARDLEAEGYTTWWDTNLLPDDGFFPETIRTQIAAAKAVIVIWAEHSVTSRWVWSEASEGDAHGKLLQVREETLDPRKVPMPFTSGNITLVSDRAKIFAALARRLIAPSNHAEVVYAEAVAKAETPAPEVERQKPKPGKSFRDFDAGPEMVVIPAGSFMMGSKDGEGEDRERPRHKVTIQRAFAVGKYPVTFDEWDAAVAAGGVSHKPGDRGWGHGRRPVINVSWNDAQAYIKWLSDKTGQPYRLLSEAEWEYACRAGSEAAYSFGGNESDLDRHAWYSSNAGGETHPVGGKQPNGFGLHDMHGNVWEWCEDVWHGSYWDKPESLKSTGDAWTTGDSSLRVLRGGSWVSDPRFLRAAGRIWGAPVGRGGNAGFRLARTLNPES